MFKWEFEKVLYCFYKTFLFKLRKMLLEQLQNMWPIIYMSLNENSIYCIRLQSSKPPDTCKWGGPKWPGILQFRRHLHVIWFQIIFSAFQMKAMVMWFTVRCSQFPRVSSGNGRAWFGCTGSEGNDAVHCKQILMVTYWLVNPSSNCILKHFDHEYLKWNTKNGEGRKEQWRRRISWLVGAEVSK